MYIGEMYIVVLAGPTGRGGHGSRYTEEAAHLSMIRLSLLGYMS